MHLRSIELDWRYLADRDRDDEYLRFVYVHTSAPYVSRRDVNVSVDNCLVCNRCIFDADQLPPDEGDVFEIAAFIMLVSQLMDVLKQTIINVNV